ncbi:MAG: hypothetical protein ACK41E_10700 [Deinococcales bacterium]
MDYVIWLVLLGIIVWRTYELHKKKQRIVAKDVAATICVLSAIDCVIILAMVPSSAWVIGIIAIVCISSIVWAIWYDQQTAKMQK